MSGYPQVEDFLVMPSYLERVVHFEQQLLLKAAELFTARGDQFDRVLLDTLGQIGTYLGIDRAYVFQFNDQQETMSNTHEWCAPTVQPASHRLQNLPQTGFSAWMHVMESGEELLISDVSALPPEWDAEKKILQMQSICSTLALPLITDQHLYGFIGFDSIHPGTVWSEESRHILKFFAGTIASSWTSEIKRQDLLNALQITSEMSRKAELASQEKSSFLSNMSHEIRTPLNAVIGAAHLLKGSDLSALQNRYVDIIQTSSQNVLEIINSILDLSRIEAGKFELNNQPFSLEDVFGRLSSLFLLPAQEKGLELQFKLDPRLPAFFIGDPLRLQQILTNLLSNAVKYSESGTIVLSASLNALREEKYWVDFDVKDQGIGLTEEEIKHLFDPFWQAAVATRQTHHGSGLGLAIVKNFCELMGGLIDVKSEPAAGSEFILSLPFGLAKQANEYQPNLPRLSTERVLILDDDLSSQRYLSKLLHLWSIKSAACKTFSEATALSNKALSQAVPFTIAIIGQQHAAGDGLELIRQLRLRHPTLHKVFVLAESDQMVLGDSFETRRLVDGFLSKPIKASTLSDELMILLNNSQGIHTDQPKASQPAHHYRFQHATLLVVEDLAINREIIKALLNAYGIEVEVARDGVMALEMAGTRRYDLILMDVQMPFMDGLEATRRIRALPDSNQARVPILALTAHAMKEDQEACLLAGMDDHVIKPIDPELLYQRLAKWLPHKLKPEQTSGDTKMNQILPASPLQLAAAGLSPEEKALFDPQIGLDLVGGNVDIYLSLLRHFIALYSDLPEQIDKLLAASDRSGLSRICHNLKSTTGHAGSSILSEQAHQLNQTIKTGAWPPLPATVHDLKAFGRDVIHLLTILSHYLDEIDSPKASAADAKPDPDIHSLALALNQLRQAMSIHDPVASRTALHELAQADLPEQLLEIRDRIQSLLDQYHFENALLVLDQTVRTIFSDQPESWNIYRDKNLEADGGQLP